MIYAENITYQAGSKIIVQETSMSLEKGKFHVIMGANGAGKSTLLKLLTGSLQPAAGKIVLDGKDIKEYSIEALARKRAVLSQHYSISFPVTAFEIVMMGRYPYFKINPTGRDIRICREAMELLQVFPLAEREYNTLSGGEAQKVQMCRILSQVNETDNAERVIFLDEPVSHLDVNYQHQLLQVVKKLSSEKITVIAVLHDINLALAYADQVLFMKNGRLMHITSLPEQITPGLIKEIFDIDSSVILDTSKNRRVIVF